MQKSNSVFSKKNLKLISLMFVVVLLTAMLSIACSKDDDWVTVPSGHSIYIRFGENDAHYGTGSSDEIRYRETSDGTLHVRIYEDDKISTVAKFAPPYILEVRKTA